MTHNIQSNYMVPWKAFKSLPAVSDSVILQSQIQFIHTHYSSGGGCCIILKCYFKVGINEYNTLNQVSLHNQDFGLAVTPA